VIELIDSNAGFAKLRTEWDEVLQKSQSNCLFLTWEWVHTWWKHLSGKRRLFLVTMRHGEELSAIAPLARKAPSVLSCWPLETLEFLGVGSVGSDYLDLISRREREQDVLPELSHYLTRKKSLLELAQINKHSCLAREFAGHWREAGGSLRESDSNVCPIINLSGHTWESYLSTLGSEHRYNFRRKLRSLSNRFEVRFEQARSEEERREALTTLLDLHSARWKNRGGSDAFCTPQIISFHDELSSLALQRGWLRLFTLRLDGKPAASLYGFHYNRVFYFYQSGFDPSYARYSVGLIAMGLAIQNAITEGVQEYDLLHGDEGYKFHWALESRALARLELYPPGSVGLACRHARGFGKAMRRMVRDMLPQSVAARLAKHKRKRAGRNPYVAPDCQDKHLPSFSLDRDG